MAEIVSLGIVMEMLYFNLAVVDMCAHRKYSFPVTWGVLVGFTLVLNGLTTRLWALMDFENGNGLFALFGIAFLLPLTWLYQEGIGRVMNILFSSWDYTMMIYCVSVQAARLLGTGRFLPRVLAIQTGLYVLTAGFFVRWIRRGLLYVLQNTSPAVNRSLRCVSLSWFLALQVCNLALLYPGNVWLPGAALLALSANAVLSYWLVFVQVRSATDVENLERKVYRDDLTKLYNRAKLFLDVEELVRRKRAFMVVFMDLNQFKAVNDQYGHLTGDAYLRAFADTVCAVLKGDGTLYRMSGDEFVCLCGADYGPRLLRMMEELPETLLPESKVPFYGCSFGCASYPGEAQSVDELIRLADRRMYAQKPSQPQRP